MASLTHYLGVLGFAQSPKATTTKLRLALINKLILFILAIVVFKHERNWFLLDHHQQQQHNLVIAGIVRQRFL